MILCYYQSHPDSGQDLVDVKNSQNHLKLGIGASRIQEFQRKVQDEFSKPREKQIPWLNKIRPPLDTWTDNLHVISVICDPGIT